MLESYGRSGAVALNAKCMVKIMDLRPKSSAMANRTAGKCSKVLKKIKHFKLPRTKSLLNPMFFTKVMAMKTHHTTRIPLSAFTELGIFMLFVILIRNSMLSVLILLQMMFSGCNLLKKQSGCQWSDSFSRHRGKLPFMLDTIACQSFCTVVMAGIVHLKCVPCRRYF